MKSPVSGTGEIARRLLLLASICSNCVRRGATMLGTPRQTSTGNTDSRPPTSRKVGKYVFVRGEEAEDF